VNPEIPPYLIMLTANTGKESIVEGLDAGATDYITKTYDSNELLACIKVGQRMIELQRNLVNVKNDLIYEAEYDSFTKIFNRKTILEILEKEISRAERSGSIFSLGIFYLDNFKLINGRYGHQTGDDVLAGFVEIVKSSLGGYDILGRYSGEKLLLIAHAKDFPPGPCGKIFERIRQKAENTSIKTRSGNISVTVSIGACNFKGSRDADSMQTQADNVMYGAAEAWQKQN